MNDLVPHIRVVAAVIEHQGRFLITQRRSTPSLPALGIPKWKVETGETDEGRAAPGAAERVGVDVAGGSTAHRTHRYDGYVVELVLYRPASRPAKNPPASRGGRSLGGAPGVGKLRLSPG